jgi:flagellar biosynthetic protein FliQ
MSQAQIISIAIQTMIVVAKIVTPILVVSLTIGLGVSMLQSVTQIQEVTLTFVPKLIGVALVILLAGNWMMGTLVSYTHQLFEMIPRLISS